MDRLGYEKEIKDAISFLESIDADSPYRIEYHDGYHRIYMDELKLEMVCNKLLTLKTYFRHRLGQEIGYELRILRIFLGWVPRLKVPLDTHRLHRISYIAETKGVGLRGDLYIVLNLLETTIDLMRYTLNNRR